MYPSYPRAGFHPLPGSVAMRGTAPAAAVSKNERFWFYANLIGFFIALSWAVRVFFLVQYVPMLTLIGRSITLAYLALFCLVWFHQVNRGQFKVIQYTVCVGVYGVILLMNSYVNGHMFMFQGITSIVGIGYHFLFFLGGMVFAYQRKYPRVPPDRLLLLGIGGLLVLMSLNFFRFVRGGLVTFEGREMFYEGVNSINLGYISGFLTVAFFALAIKFREPAARILFGLCSLIMAASLIAVAARGALFYAAITVVLISLISFRFTLANLKNWLPFLGISAVAAAALMWFRPGFLITRWNLVYERFMPTVDWAMGRHFAGEGAATAGRLDIYREYLGQFNAWWFNGLDGYTGQYPHNFFLEVGVRFGLLGIPIIVVVFIVLWKIFKLALHRQRVDALDLAIVGIFVFALLQSMTSMSLEMFRGLWGAMGYLLILKVGNIRDRSPARRPAGAAMPPPPPGSARRV